MYWCPSVCEDELLKRPEYGKSWLEIEQIACKTMLQKAFWLNLEAWIDNLYLYVKVVAEMTNL
jgi:hypothetical protein